MAADPRFPLGCEVQVKGQSGLSGPVIKHEVRGDGKFYYQVFLESSRKPFYCEDDLTDVGPAGDALSRALLGDWGLPQDFLAYLTLRKLNTPLSDVLYSYLASRTDLLPHQYIPLLKLLESPRQRILIADEVGLGKTIEAGLILSEYRTRSEIRRVLVVCQGSLLMSKWVAEMRNRFDEPFELLTRDRFLRFLEDYEAGRDPDLRAVASLALLRQDDLLDRMSESMIEFDVTVVDEAHRFRNASSQSYALGKVLSHQSNVLVFLTATPLHLGNQDLFNLLHLLDPARFNSHDYFEQLLQPVQLINECLSILRATQETRPLRQQLALLSRLRQHEWLQRDPNLQQIQARLLPETLDRPARVDVERLLVSLSPLSHIVTRTRRVDVNLQFAHRTPVTVRVALTPTEATFLEGVEELARRIYQLGGQQQGCSFAVLTLRRQVASCIPAMVRYLKDILAQGNVPLDEELELDLDSAMLTSFYLHPTHFDRARELITQGQGLTTDSKFNLFHRELEEQFRDGRRKVILFSFFKRTLAYLSRRLRELGLTTYLLSGDVPPAEREELIERFREEMQPCILLSSEVGGEGLDFQFASVMVNYDLPWNPMVVEQRIGRIDRYGQKAERVVIYNFSVENTVEERIFERLYERIEIFRRSIGDLEAILGEDLSQLTRDILSYKLTPREEEERADRIADAILRQEQTLKSLEKEGARIGGDDGYFLSRIEEVRTGKKFMTAAELERFVRHGVTAVCPTSRLIGGSRSHTFRFAGSGELMRELAPMATRHPQSGSLLPAVAQVGRDKEYTFDSAVANRYKNLEYITPRHPLVRVLRHHLEAPANLVDAPLAPTAAVTIRSSEFGEYLMFCYFLTVEGMRREVSLVPVPVRLPQLCVEPEQGEALLLALNDSHEPWANPRPLSDDDIQQARSAANDWVLARKDILYLEHGREADRLLRLRRQSIEATYQVIRAQRQDRLASAREPRIARMLQASVENLDARHQAELQALEVRRHVQIEEELFGIALIRLCPPD